MIDGSAEGWMHRALCLEAEISARNAANYELGKQVDILEEGLAKAKKQIAELQRQLEFRQVTGNAASRTEAKK